MPISFPTALSSSLLCLSMFMHDGDPSQAFMNASRDLYFDFSSSLPITTFPSSLVFPSWHASHFLSHRLIDPGLAQPEVKINAHKKPKIRILIVLVFMDIPPYKIECYKQSISDFKGVCYCYRPEVSNGESKEYNCNC